MKLSSLTKVTAKRLKRVGQGKGSGRGKKSGRGGRGQTSRNVMPLSFEGGALTIIKRLPFMRGRGKNKSFRNQPLGVNVKLLNSFKKGEIVDVKFLIDQGIVEAEYAKKYGVKILGDGDITVPLTIKLPVSKEASKKIEKAGGRVERDSSVAEKN
jgi:large subunit ribosomal protein L15